MTIENAPARPEPRGIAIVAYGATKILAPWDDPSWTMWSMNDAYAHFAKRLSALFEMHPISHYTDHAQYVDDHESRMADLAHRIRVYLAFPNPKIPDAILYPLEEVVPYGRDYFQSTLPYMIGEAIRRIVESQKAKDGVFLPKIGLWGCDMQLTSEYAKERACTEYWLGRAEGYGIEVTVPDDSPILKAGYRYGYETAEIDARRRIFDARDRDLRTMLADAERQAALANEQVQNLRGMRDELAFIDVNLTTRVPTGRSDSIIHRAGKVTRESIE